MNQHVTQTLDATRIRSALRKIVDASPSIFSFRDDPALASLCAVMGLHFEMGLLDFDRLSRFMGVSLSSEQENPYHKEIVLHPHKGCGLILTRCDGLPFLPKTPVLSQLIDPSSLSDDGIMRKIVIFPAMVADRFRGLGFDLVIVRDWIVMTALARDGVLPLNYVVANDWEMQSVIALTQTTLMKRRQLPFFGTHDIVDHQFGADVDLYTTSMSVAEDGDRLLKEIFADRDRASHYQFVLAYILGVILDDLAQPRWYRSQAHHEAAQQVLHWLRESTLSPVTEAFDAEPENIAYFIATMRRMPEPIGRLDANGAPFVHSI